MAKKCLKAFQINWDAPLSTLPQETIVTAVDTTSATNKFLRAKRCSRRAIIDIKQLSADVVK